MRKKLLAFLLVIVMALSFTFCGENNDSEFKDDRMENDCIDGTDAEKIIEALVKQYKMVENNSGSESKINHTISYNGYNYDDNKAIDYDITSNNKGEIELATFTTYTGDLDYLTFCATLLETDLIKSDNLKKWILKSTEDSDIQIGDGNFSLIYDYQNNEGSITLYVDGDLN